MPLFTKVSVGFSRCLLISHLHILPRHRNLIPKFIDGHCRNRLILFMKCQELSEIDIGQDIAVNDQEWQTGSLRKQG